MIESAIIYSRKELDMKVYRLYPLNTHTHTHTHTHITVPVNIYTYKL